MRSHHERFRWTHATRNPTDAREVKENEKVVNELNSYRALAIVDKQPHSTVVDKLRNWEKDDTYDIVYPNRSGDGFSVPGLRLASPENHRVKKPSADEQLSVINFGRLTGSLQGGTILTIPSAEHLTGAIPVVNTEVPGEMFYYIPAQIEPLAMNRHYFEYKPSFIVMKSGEMPSYVFWKRKAQFPPSYTDSQLLDHQRLTRSGAPTPEPRSAPVAGPSTEPRAASLAVNTDKTTRAARERQIEPEWEIFDPRLEENPLEFLDYYNACLKGRKGVRSKLMLREADIDRVNYISPCLAHNHKKADKEAETATSDASPMDIDPVPTLPTPEVPGVPVPDPSKAPAPKPWKQPEPIGADDPAWKNFFARIDREKEIRGARIRPKPVFTSEYCNAPGTKSDPKKAVLTRELYDKLYHRAVTADREIEKRSKCCFACGLEWTLCPTTRHVHYQQHREEFKLHRTHLLESRLYTDDPLRVQDLDVAKAPMPKGVPGLNWFRDLEQKILDMENELLEREQLCRICDAHVDFADESNADHYRKHKEERKQLRVLGDKIPLVPHTPPTSGKGTSTGFEESPEARTWSGWKGKRTPEFLKGSGRKRGEEEAAKEQARELANSVEISAQQSRETGGLQDPIQISSDVSSSAASDDLEDIFMDGLDGSIYSDVIGSTTAPLAFPPLFERAPVPEVPTSEKTDLDFLSGQNADTITTLRPEQISTFGRFKDNERRSASQTREPYPDLMDIDAVEAHLDVPIEIESDDDDLYAYPTPPRADSTAQDEADFDRAEIIQAIRTTSGELLALDDDSDDAEEVPEELETEDADNSDANEDEDADEDEHDSEDEDNIPFKSKRMEFFDYSDSEDDDKDDGDEDDDDDEDRDSPKYPLSGGGFVIDEITDAATGDLPLTPTERSKAREFVQEMVEEALASPDQTDQVATKERVQTLTRNLFVRQETQKLDAAKIRALATGNNWRQKEGQRLRQQEAPTTPATSSGKWSTKTLSSDTPRTPVSPWSPVASVSRSPTTPTVSGVSDQHDGLDLKFSDLNIDHLLTEAVEWGCGLNDMRALSNKAWEVATALQEETPQRTEESRRLIRDMVQQFVRYEIKAEKRLRKQGTRSSHQKSSTTTTPSSAGWSTQTVGGRTPVNRRPFSLPTTRRRKVSDTSFQPGPPTPFNPDEVSPRLPKMPRKSKDPLYRPDPALPSPTTPPATPKLNKHSSAPKPAARTAKKVEKKLKKKEAKKTEKRQAKKAVKKDTKRAVKKDIKKVAFDNAQASNPAPKPSTSSKTASPQVVVTKNPTRKTAAVAPAKAVTSKSSKKSSAKKAGPVSGVKKTTAKAKKSKTVAPATRPKRQAAIEAEKSFGKTKVVG